MAIVFMIFVQMNFWKLDKIKYPKTYARQLRITRVVLFFLVIVFASAIANLILR